MRIAHTKIHRVSHTYKQQKDNLHLKDISLVFYQTISMHIYNEKIQWTPAVNPPIININTLLHQFSLFSPFCSHYLQIIFVINPPIININTSTSIFTHFFPFLFILSSDIFVSLYHYLQIYLSTIIIFR